VAQNRKKVPRKNSLGKKEELKAGKGPEEAGAAAMEGKDPGTGIPEKRNLLKNLLS
jgi:hypothetical protein